MLTYERRSSKADFIQSSILWFSYDLVSNIFLAVRDTERMREKESKSLKKERKREREREKERKNERKWDWERSRTARIEIRGEFVIAKSLYDSQFGRGAIGMSDERRQTKRFSSKVVSSFERSSLKCKDRKRCIILPLKYTRRITIW